MMVQASVSTEESKHFKSKIRALEEENYRLKKDVNGVFTWDFSSVWKTAQARNWILLNPTWSASKSGHEQIYYPTSERVCSIFQTIENKNNTVCFYLQQKTSNLDLFLDSGPRLRSRKMNPDCDFPSKFERIPS
jgi:hypothetical protein